MSLLRLFMKKCFNAIVKAIRILVGVSLVFVSLWALLLPPAFPYSTHAIVNAAAVTIKAGDRGQITYAPTSRSTVLQVGGRVAIVKRDLAKVKRKLEEQNFTKLKLEDQLKNLNEIVEVQELKLQEANDEAERKRLSTGKFLNSSLVAAKEKAKLYKADLAEKIADLKRVKPLFDDDIVTAAQWSETRKLKIEAEKLLRVAESELDTTTARLEGYQRGGSGLSEEKDGISIAKMEAYDKELSNLSIQQAQLRAELQELHKQINSTLDYNKADQTYELTTPIEGIVWHRHAVSGEVLTDEQVVAEVADVTSLFVDAYFRRDFLYQISIGDHASIYLLGDTRFLNGSIVDIQVQESKSRGAKIINTVELDRSLLKVKIETSDKDFNPEDIGQLAKVLITNGQPGWFDRSRIWLSLLLRSHTNQ
ncbi:MAG: efflux RND transporter periplasmic adaptor subunit [Verrucomicrobiales bacterium]|nr:efflux RND transporter periplasmic adaptor subunit [Verrucomicrobiales bacterium]